VSICKRYCTEPTCERCRESLGHYVEAQAPRLWRWPRVVAKVSRLASDLADTRAQLAHCRMLLHAKEHQA